ncbi:hypothetical protein RPX00_24965 [Amycolatopsis sp. WGS_07]
MLRPHREPVSGGRGLAVRRTGRHRRRRTPAGTGQRRPRRALPDEAAAAGVARLPQSLSDALAAFEADDVLPGAFGSQLATTLLDVRRAEVAELGSLPPDELCRAMRWLH